jgi:hypothetical protein
MGNAALSSVARSGGRLSSRPDHSPQGSSSPQRGARVEELPLSRRVMRPLWINESNCYGFVGGPRRTARINRSDQGEHQYCNPCPATQLVHPATAFSAWPTRSMSVLQRSIIVAPARYVCKSGLLQRMKRQDIDTGIVLVGENGADRVVIGAPAPIPAGR